MTIRITKTYLAKDSSRYKAVFVMVEAWGDYRQVQHFPELFLTSLPTTFLAS
jgi:hypothetical protein